ncbi:hypothetical protein [Mycoplasma sp. P36-A1]
MTDIVFQSIESVEDLALFSKVYKKGMIKLNIKTDKLNNPSFNFTLIVI